LKRKSVKRSNSAKKVIIAASIIVLNVIGISYANFNENINLLANASTSNIEVAFRNGDLKHISGNVIGSHVEYESDKLTVIAEVYSDYQGILVYTVENNGRLPVKVNNEIIEPNDYKSFQIDVDSSFTGNTVEYSQISD